MVLMKKVGGDVACLEDLAAMDPCGTHLGQRTFPFAFK